MDLNNNNSNNVFMEHAREEANRLRRDSNTYLEKLKEDDPKYREELTKFMLDFNRQWNDNTIDPDFHIAKYPVSVGKFYNSLNVQPKLFWQRYLYRCDENRIAKRMAIERGIDPQKPQPLKKWSPHQRSNVKKYKSTTTGDDSSVVSTDSTSSSVGPRKQQQKQPPQRRRAPPPPTKSMDSFTGFQKSTFVRKPISRSKSMETDDISNGRPKPRRRDVDTLSLSSGTYHGKPKRRDVDSVSLSSGTYHVPLNRSASMNSSSKPKKLRGSLGSFLRRKSSFSDESSSGGNTNNSSDDDDGTSSVMSGMSVKDRIKQLGVKDASTAKQPPSNKKILRKTTKPSSAAAADDGCGGSVASSGFSFASGTSRSMPVQERRKKASGGSLFPTSSSASKSSSLSSSPIPPPKSSSNNKFSNNSFAGITIPKLKPVPAPQNPWAETKSELKSTTNAPSSSTTTNPTPQETTQEETSTTETKLNYKIRTTKSKEAHIQKEGSINTVLDGKVQKEKKEEQIESGEGRIEKPRERGSTYSSSLVQSRKNAYPNLFPNSANGKKIDKNAAVEIANQRSNLDETYETPLCNENMTKTQRKELLRYQVTFRMTYNETRDERNEIVKNHKEVADRLVKQGKLSSKVQFWERYFYRCDADRILKQAQVEEKQQEKQAKKQEQVENAAMPDSDDDDEEDFVAGDGITGCTVSSDLSDDDNDFDDPEITTIFDRKAALELANRRRGNDRTYDTDLYHDGMTKREKKELSNFQYAFRLNFDETQKERDRILKEHSEVAERLKGTVLPVITFWERYFWRCGVDQIMKQARIEEREIEREDKKEHLESNAMPGDDIDDSDSTSSKLDHDEENLDPDIDVNITTENSEEGSENVNRTALSIGGSNVSEFLLDGRWRVEWPSDYGKQNSINISVKKNRYYQAGNLFEINFEDPIHPYIAWPQSKNIQWVKEDIDLTKHPKGPEVGGKLLWATTSPSFPEIMWIRESIASEEAQLRAEKAELKKAETSSGATEAIPKSASDAIAKAKDRADKIAKTTPLDGRWRIEWTNTNGNNRTKLIRIENNEYNQSGIVFRLNFEDPVHPHIKWPRPGDRQTIQDGVNLIEEPEGPQVGARIRWETTSDKFPEFFWVRETFAIEEAKLKAEEEQKRKAEEKRAEEAKKMNEEISGRKPFDGRWSVEWTTAQGKGKSLQIRVENNEYKRSGFSFRLNFGNPKHPFIQWPNSKDKQTVQEGVDLIKEPTGPVVGDRIRWTTTNTKFSEMFWIRRSTAEEEAAEEARLKAEAEEKKRKAKEAKELNKKTLERKPFDGRWSVEWTTASGKEKSMQIRVENNEYMQSEFPFRLNFEDPKHPFIQWPSSPDDRQTIQDGVDMIKEPNGPPVGGRVRWTTTNSKFPELFWVRKTVAEEEAMLKAQAEEAMRRHGEISARKPFDGCWSVEWTTGSGEERSMQIRVENNEYVQSGSPFSLNFGDPKHPFIQWPSSPNDRQTIQDGVDLSEEPEGPAVGSRIRWTTTHDRFPELFWVRKSIAKEEAAEKARLKLKREEARQRNEDISSRRPFDGRWSIEWTSATGEERSMKIRVENNSYIQSDSPFTLNFEDPKHPFIQWPNDDRQTVQEGVDLVNEPSGPAIGARVRWTTTNEKFPELFWVRTTSAEEEAAEHLRLQEARQRSIELSTRKPLDGTWSVKWKNDKGEQNHILIEVENNQYTQSGFSFHLDFEDPKHPFILWPDSQNRQTIQEGVDLINEPKGPTIGARVSWTATSTNISELYWVRKSIGKELETDSSATIAEGETPDTPDENEKEIVTVAGEETETPDELGEYRW